MDLRRLYKINDMAIERDEFMNDIKNHFPQIIQNLALILYAKEYIPFQVNVNHWKNELDTQISGVSDTELKDNNSVNYRQRAFNQVADKWDFYKPLKQFSKCRLKFRDEKVIIKQSWFEDHNELLSRQLKEIGEIISEQDFDKLDKFIEGL